MCYDGLSKMEEKAFDLVNQALLAFKNQWESLSEKYGIFEPLTINNAQIQYFYALVRDVSKYLKEIIDALQNSAITGIIIGLMFFMFSWMSSLTNFRLRALAARKGHGVPNIHTIHVSDACNFAGLQVQFHVQ